MKEMILESAQSVNKSASAAAKYRVCVRCIIDGSVPGVVFDENGECNFCKLHDKMDKEYPLNEAGRRQLDKLIQEMKAAGKGKKYDCVLGVSGGRDSIYTLYLLVKMYGLRPLAVHFNDGFGNPVAGENMIKATKRLGADLRTISSDWRESRDLKLAFLKASTPDMEEGTDVGIATALYGVAARENVRHVIFGQSFRTEGICPLSWNYLDGKYLKAVHRQFGSVPLRPWKAEDPGFNLDLSHILYYVVWKRIKVIPILYYVHYVRSEIEAVIKKELDWVNTGAHYWDDLYQSLMAYILRVKFNVDRRKFNYSALVRSGQMPREEALRRVQEIYVLEDEDVIRLCVKRLGITQQELQEYMARPPKTFRDYPNHYNMVSKFKFLIKILSRLHLVPGPTYDKYFNCGA